MYWLTTITRFSKLDYYLTSFQGLPIHFLHSLLRCLSCVKVYECNSEKQPPHITNIKSNATPSNKIRRESVLLFWPVRMERSPC